MKRKLFLAVMSLMCLASVTGGTLAYFTDSGTAHNVITTGAVKIAVEEWQMVDGKQAPYPQKEVDIMPGSTVSKVVCIRNQEAESYIRAEVNVILTDGNGEPMELTESEVSAIVNLEMNAEDWKQLSGEERWWYYQYPVAAGEATQPLFTGAQFSGSGMGNRFQNCTIQILVSAQAVQTANNADSAMNANGWPEG